MKYALFVSIVFIMGASIAFGNWLAATGWLGFAMMYFYSKIILGGQE